MLLVSSTQSQDLQTSQPLQPLGLGRVAGGEYSDQGRGLYIHLRIIQPGEFNLNPVEVEDNQDD
jgi:hypothetical protein